MANENDSRIVELLLKVPKEKQLEYFLEYNNAILDDSTYWQVLAGIWINTDICTPNLDKWITLFSSTRRNRHKLMKKHDRQVWRSLPQNITVYRAINNTEDINKSISWTLEMCVCERLYPGKKIVTRNLQRQSIVAYFNRRDESEVIYLPKTQVR